MIPHLFKMVWNRRKANTLIFIEVFVAFLVLVGVCTAGVFSWERWQRPLGFTWEDRWIAMVIPNEEFRALDDEAKNAVVQGHLNLIRELESLPEIQRAGLGENVAYSGNTSSWTSYVHGVQVNVLTSLATPGVKEFWGFEVLQGRWLQEGDHALDRTPAVVTADLAAGWYPGEEPLGKLVPTFNDDGERQPPQEGDNVIVGVVNDIRREGEFEPARYAMWSPVDPGELRYGPPNYLMLTLAPGTDAAFEEKLARTLQRAQPGWTFHIRSLEGLREARLREHLLPLVIFSIVGAFMVGVVGLGLVGVLWQGVTRRTAELGVRRALGATAAGVRGQVLGEILALTTLAVAVGIALAIQFPLLQILSNVPTAVYVAGILLAMVVVYSFVILCGLYPSWLATQIHPARALQYE